jgi:hypothetical protein
MRMLMVICPTNRAGEVLAVLKHHGVHAYSELAPVVGDGATGKKLGTHAWPERSSLLFSVVPGEIEKELAAALREYRAKLFPGEGLKVFSLPVEEEI